MRGVGAAGGDWLLVPEIPMTVLGEGLDPVQLARAYGLRSAAIVHDLIPIRLAHLYDAGAHALYQRYFRMFADADLVFATTDLVAGHLREHLQSERLTVPPIAVVPLPAQFADLPRIREAPAIDRPSSPLRLLTVSTWEPRKNLPLLMRAVRLAQERSGHAIHLTLVGRRGSHPEHDAEVEALLAATPNATGRDRVKDRELADLYARCHISVYPSCDEGFGMPVLESLWLGRPCLCHAGSAMAEVAPGGGTLMLDMSSEAAIADALVRLAEKPDLLARLAGEVLERSLRTWTDYTVDVVGCLQAQRTYP
jgi:glycosyltransferase involved in cell wall biosynthesis